MTAAERYAEWALALALDDVPAPAVDAAKRHLLDGLGCALAAVRSSAAPYALEVARALPAPPEAHVIGSAEEVAGPAAALANGTLVHALDYDDTHADALVHATAAVLPAAFAVGEERDASGADVLAAAIAGYEVVSRLGAAVRHGFHARGFHATSVCGVFASALIAARLTELDAARATNALGIAGSMASGSLEFLTTGSATKQLHPGWAGHAGIMAARLAAAGADGPATIFEGEHGVYHAYADAPVDETSLTDELGNRWEVTRITIKPYPACQLSHASLDALAEIREPIDVDAIDGITFDLPKESVEIVAEPAADKRAPRTPYEGKFSLPYCAAAMLLDGEIGLDSFEPDAVARPTARALAERIGYRVIDLGTAAAAAPGHVEVHLRDGHVLTGEVPSTRGGPDNPLSDAEVRAKFSANAARDDAAAIADVALGIEGLDRIGALMEMLA